MLYGRPIDELTREELVEALNFAAGEIHRLQGEQDALRPHVDYGAYITNKARTK
jgi:hypothetical protein